MGNQLLCTIGNISGAQGTIKQITDTYQLLNNKIRIFEPEHETGELFFIYNITGLKPDKLYLKNTMSIHAKKETNTFYTINALNKLIVELNGVLDVNYKVTWSDFSNILLLTNGNIAKKIKIKFKEMYEL